jgi:PIN domain nuclease of toxin-antitoxin system
MERRGRLRVLLDTHTLLWSFISPSSLSREARAVLAEKTVEVLVSAASAWEIATKVRLGKLPEAEELERRFVQSIHEVGYTLLAIDADTALRAGRLVAGHGDPFDRILAAQALALDIPILSKDPKLDLFAVRRVW